MIPEAGFLFAVAAVSMSLASLAGLVVAFRRSGTWAGHDLYRLRQIVEFGFANALFALSLIPLVAVVGSVENSVRIVATTALAVLVAHAVVLLRRQRQTSPVMGLQLPVFLVDLVALALSTAAIVVASIPAWEAALLALLARPMLAFLLVLSTLRAEGG